MKTKVYQYPKCSTCRKALQWLDAREVAYEAIDIVATPPSLAELRRAREGGLPLKSLFNTSGQSYRDGKWTDKIAKVTEAQALGALLADGKLIKRPFVLTDDVVLVGFDEAAYQKVFASR
jgi:Spx/MgsR family transcriptional regulator